LPNPISSSETAVKFPPTQVRRATGDNKALRTIVLGSEVDNPLNRTIINPQDSVAYSLVRRESGLAAEEHQKAYLKALQNSTVGPSSSAAISTESWLDSVAAGARNRQRVLECSGLIETDPELSCLLLQDLLDVYVGLTALGEKLSAAQVESIALWADELQTLQTNLRSREVAELRAANPFAATQLALNHLTLGALALLTKKLDLKSPRVKLLKSTSSWQVANPLRKPQPIASASVVDSSVVSILAKAALEDLRIHKVDPALFTRLADLSWINGALADYFKTDSTDSVTLMSILIRHVGTVRKTRKEQLEISLLHALGFLAAVSAAAVFMKVKASSPFASAAIQQADSDSLFTTLQAPASPASSSAATASSSPLSAISSNATTNQTASASASSLPSLTLLPSSAAASSFATAQATGSGSASPLSSALISSSASPISVTASALASPLSSALISSSASPISATASALASPLSSAFITSSASPISATASATGSLSASPTPSPSNIIDPWALAFGGANNEASAALALDANNSLLVTGYTATFGAGSNDLLLAKFYANSTLAWAQTLGGAGNDVGCGVALAADGSIAVSGYTSSFGTGLDDILLTRFYANGTLAWAKTLGTSNDDDNLAMALGSDGSLSITGWTGGASMDIWLAKINASGSLAWAKKLGGTATDIGRGIALLSDGSIMMTGNTVSFATGIAGTSDLLLARIYANGTLAWAKTLGGTNDDWGLAVTTGADDSTVVTGYTQSFGAGSTDLLLTKWAANGTLMWAKTLGGASAEQGFALALDPDDNILAAGTTQSFGAGNNDALLSKWTANGTLLWAKTLGGANSDGNRALILSSNGSIGITGSTQSYGAGSGDILLAQLNAQADLAFNNSLIQLINNAQVGSINPSVTDITSTISYSTLALTLSSWNTPVNANFNPFVVYLPASPSPSATPSAMITPSRTATGSTTATPTPSPSATASINTWALALGSANADNGYAVALGADDSIVVTGTTQSFGAVGTDLLLAKLYANGSLAWSKTLGGISSDYGQALALGPDDSIFVTGYTSRFGAGFQNVLLAKCYANGSLAWANTLGGANYDYGTALTLGSDGSIVVTGFTASFGAGNNDVLLAKWYANGTLAWAKTLGGAGNDYGRALALDTDGSIVVTGYTNSFDAGNNDVLLAKWYANGTLAWAKTLGGEGYSLALDSDGSILVLGNTDSFGAGLSDVLLAKFYANGTLAWANTLGGSSSEFGYALALGPDGNIVASGVTNSFGAGFQDVLLVKFYANGSLAWANTLGGASSDRGRSLALGSNGSIVASGFTSSYGAGSSDVLLAYLDFRGQLSVNNSLIQPITNAQVQNIHPNVSDISSLISASSPAFTVKRWNSTISTNVNPYVVYLPASPSPTPSITSSPSRSASGSSTAIPTPTSSAAQTGNTWALTLGGASDDHGFALALGSNDSVVVTGDTQSFGAGNQDVLLAKFYVNGTLAWANTLGGANNDAGNALSLSPDGSIVISGDTTSFGAGNLDVLLAKWYANGTLAWANTLGGSSNDRSFALAHSLDGSILVLGSTQSFGAGSNDVLLSKWHANGTLAWVNTLGGLGWDDGNAIAIGPDGSIVVLGYTYSFGTGSQDFLLAKWYANGTLAWANTLGGTSSDNGKALALGSDGSILVSGYISSFGAGNTDVLLAKWHSNGTLAWANTLGGASGDGGNALALDSDGSVVVSGYTQSFGAGSDDVLLAKWYANGTLAWANTLGSTDTDYGSALAIDSDGSIVVSGYTFNFGAGNNDVLLTYLNVRGQLAVNNSLIRPITNAQVQSIHPNVSDITGLINVSSPALSAQNWNSVISTSINPNITYLASSLPSASPARRRLAPTIFGPERADSPRHRWLRPEPSAQISAMPLSTRVAATQNLAQLRPMPSTSDRLATETQRMISGTNSYGSLEMAAGMASLCLILLFIWRLVGGVQCGSRHRQKSIPCLPDARLFATAHSLAPEAGSIEALERSESKTHSPN